ALHAGCKVIPVDGNPTTVLIVGLSGTGKTTTTFTTQLGSKPAQDDFVALMPGGHVYTTENGCFAKTFGLDPQFEAAIYYATTKPDAYLENVSVDADGAVDFFDTSYTKNGRTTWPFSYVDPCPADPVPTRSSRVTWPTWETGCSNCWTATSSRCSCSTPAGWAAGTTTLARRRSPSRSRQPSSRPSSRTPSNGQRTRTSGTRSRRPCRASTMPRSSSHAGSTSARGASTSTTRWSPG